jgi:hypothetical protein
VISRIGAVRFSARSVPVALALVAVFAYGLLLPLTGFYWDDWPFAWIARFQGPSEFIPAFLGFRPFLGPIFYLTTSVLPANPAVWQLFAILIRFLSAWAAWYSLRQVWPRAHRLGLSAALLFLVYPGYSQHWVALTHINQEWISLIAYTLSFGIGVRAVRAEQPSSALVAVAVCLQIVGLLPTEYFVGLEFLRPVLFWIVLSEYPRRPASRLAVTLKLWAPYLLMWLVNAAWLGFYYGSGLYISYDLAAARAFPGLLRLLGDLGWAFLKAGLYVWVQIVPLALSAVSAPSSLATFAIIVLTFAIVGPYLLKLDLPPLTGTTARVRGTSVPRSLGAGDRGLAARWAVLVGIIGILLGRLPSSAADLPLTLQSSFDRLTISMLPGASLFVAGLVQMSLHTRRARDLTIACLVALGVGQQFFNANIFRRDWERQNEIYWQLAWRIPSLAPHTAILTQQMPLDYETDLGMTAAVNWIYAGDDAGPFELPYAVVYTEKRLGGEVLPALEPDLPMRLPLRRAEFIGNTSDVLAVYVPPSGCLRVFDPSLDDGGTYSRFSEAVTAAIPLSDPSRILIGDRSASPPSPPFGEEPEHAWCYFYEKAELARQARDWHTITDLWSQATRSGQKPLDPFEWLPFIEAEARVGDSDWAVHQARESLELDPRMQRGLCALWGRIQSEALGGARTLAIQMLDEMQCER